MRINQTAGVKHCAQPVGFLSVPTCPQIERSDLEFQSPSLTVHNLIITPHFMWGN